MIEIISEACLSEYRLDLHRLGLETPKERDETQIHLGHCASCRNFLAQMQHLEQMDVLQHQAKSEQKHSIVRKQNALDTASSIVPLREPTGLGAAFFARWMGDWGVSIRVAVGLGLLGLMIFSAQEMWWPFEENSGANGFKRTVILPKQLWGNLPTAPSSRLVHPMKAPTPTSPLHRHLAVRPSWMRSLRLTISSNVPGTRVFLDGKYIGAISRKQRPFVYRIPGPFRQTTRFLLALYPPVGEGYTPRVWKRRILAKKHRGRVSLRAHFVRHSQRFRGRVPVCFRRSKGPWRKVVFIAPSGSSFEILGQCRQKELFSIAARQTQIVLWMPAGRVVSLRVNLPGGDVQEQTFEVLRTSRSQMLSFQSRYSCGVESIQRKVEKKVALKMEERVCLHEIKSGSPDYFLSRCLLALDYCRHGWISRGRGFLHPLVRQLPARLSLTKRFKLGRSLRVCRAHTQSIQILQKLYAASLKLPSSRRLKLQLSLVDELARAHEGRYDQHRRAYDIAQALHYRKRQGLLLPAKHGAKNTQLRQQIARLQALLRQPH